MEASIAAFIATPAPVALLRTASPYLVQRAPESDAAPVADAGKAADAVQPPSGAVTLNQSTDKTGSTALQEPPALSFAIYHGANLKEVNDALPEEAGTMSFDTSISTQNDPATSATLTVKQSINMPKWAEREKQCPAVQKAWDDFYSALLKHENGHVAIDRREFAGAHQRFIGKAAGDIQPTLDALNDHVRAVQDAYDTETGHGTKQTPPTIIDLGAKCNEAGAANEGDGAPPSAQAKLTVGPSDDPFEREADRIADQVMRTGASPGISVANRAIQRAILQRCPCEHLEEEERKPLRRREAGRDEGAFTAPPIVDEVLAGGGRPLDGETRAFMEPRFGHDFSSVRIHTDARASESAAAVNARAYTVGQNMVFRSGEYAPQTPEGGRLLAHELAHVLQQAGPAPGLQRWTMPYLTQKNNKELIQDVDENDSVAAIKEISNFGEASVPQRLKMLRLLSEQVWVGPRDERAQRDIWLSFGDSFVDIASQNIDRLKKCMSRQAQESYYPIELIPQYVNLKNRFRSDVVARVNGYLKQNQDLATSEIDRLGLDNPGTPATEQQKNERHEMQEAAKRLQPTLDKKKALEDIILGYQKPYGRSLLAHGEAIRFGECTDAPLPIPVPGPSRMTWQQVKQQYDPLVAIILNVTTRYPSLYALIKEEKVVDFEKSKDDGQMRKMISESMHSVLKNIEKTRAEINNPGSNLPLEMHPIHEQLFKENALWTQAFPHYVGEKAVEQFKDAKFWDDLAIGSVGAAAFAFASLATGGAAILLLAAGAGISAGQAAASWDKYYTMRSAANTNLSDKTALIEQGEVTTALMDAVLATATAFLDAYSAAKELHALGEGADQTAKAAAEAKVKNAEERLTAAEGREAKELEAVEEVKVGGVEDARGEIHELGVKPNGVICRHSKEVCGFGALVGDRINTLNATMDPEMVKALSSDMKALGKRADAIAERAVEASKLTGAERTKALNSVLADAAALDKELVQLEKANDIMQRIVQAGGQTVVRDLDVATMEVFRKVYGEKLAEHLHNAKTIASYESLAVAVRGHERAYQAHHIVERSVLKRIGHDAEVCPAIILTSAEHTKITTTLATHWKGTTDLELLTKQEILAGYEAAYAHEPRWLDEVRRYFK